MRIPKPPTHTKSLKGLLKTVLNFYLSLLVKFLTSPFLIEYLFPNTGKVAKLKPLFKKGKKVDPFNYRPISLLPLISKIIENIVYDDTYELLLGNKLFLYSSACIQN